MPAKINFRRVRSVALSVVTLGGLWFSAVAAIYQPMHLHL
jgi:hypothetical protein